MSERDTLKDELSTIVDATARYGGDEFELGVHLVESGMLVCQVRVVQMEEFEVRE